ncbi:endonuclease III domain-containing protein [Methylobacterium sp. NFXW15]|uniref:endonuclease III domain-containing protein n=1 Tax=Methylobacterium sp. NFXW15 TaxID=2819512 RepID=UPI003CEEBA3A
MASDTIHGLKTTRAGRVRTALAGGSPKRVAAVMARFAAADPEPKAGLNIEDPFRLLVTVVLSAQSTGPTVSRISDALFARAASPKALLALGEEGILDIIRPVGLGPSKTRSILKLCAALDDTFDGEVPRTAAELRRLPGIGRKTAEVTSNFAFGEKVIAVDTHIFRVSNRIPLAPGRTADAVADGLAALVPEAYKDGAHVWLFRHGRDTCTARKPACGRCVVSDLCTWPEKSVPT